MCAVTKHMNREEIDWTVYIDPDAHINGQRYIEKTQKMRESDKNQVYRRFTIADDAHKIVV